MKKSSFHLQNPLSAFKELCSKRPACAVAVALITLFGGTYVTLEFACTSEAKACFAYGLLEELLIVLGLFTAGVFLTENAFPEPKGLKKFLLMLPAALIAFVLGNMAFDGDSVIAPALSARFGTLFGERRTAFLIAYAAITFSMTVWLCFRRSGEKDFSAYALGVFSRVVRDGCVLVVVLIGLALIDAAVVELLWDKIGNVMLPIVSLIVGLWFCPSVACAFLSGEKDPPRFTVTLVRRVLLILCAAAYAVILVYILKILVTWTFPKNTVFSVLTALFVLSMPVALMTESRDKNDLSSRIASAMPTLFLPFAAMQALCLGLRIVQYGLTTSRYLGVVLILFECTVSVWHLFARRSVAGVLPVLAVFAAVCAFAPKIDCMRLPDALQAKTLRAGLSADLDVLSETAYSRLNAAASYQGSDGIRKDWLAEYFTEEETETVKMLQKRLAERNDGVLDSKYIYADLPNAYPLDVSGFKQLYEIRMNADDREDGFDLRAVPISMENAGEDRTDGTELSLPEAFRTADLSTAVAVLVEAERMDPGRWHAIDPEVILPDGSVLRFTWLWLEITGLAGEVKSVNANGLLLVK